MNAGAGSFRTQRCAKRSNDQHRTRGGCVVDCASHAFKQRAEAFCSCCVSPDAPLSDTCLHRRRHRASAPCPCEPDRDLDITQTRWTVQRINVTSTAIGDVHVAAGIGIARSDAQRFCPLHIDLHRAAIVRAPAVSSIARASLSLGRVNGGHGLPCPALLRNPRSAINPWRSDLASRSPSPIAIGASSSQPSPSHGSIGIGQHRRLYCHRRSRFLSPHRYQQHQHR